MANEYQVTSFGLEALRDGAAEANATLIALEVLRATTILPTAAQVTLMGVEVLRTISDVPTGETHRGAVSFHVGLGLGLKASAVRQAQVGFEVGLSLGLDGEKDPPFNCQHAEPIEWSRAEPGQAVWTAHKPAPTVWTKETALQTTLTRAPRQTTTWTKQ